MSSNTRKVIIPPLTLNTAATIANPKEYDFGFTNLTAYITTPTNMPTAAKLKKKKKKITC